MKYERIPYIRYVPIIIISLILYRVVNNIESVGGLVSRFFSILSYFLWGFGIAYLLNPLMKNIEERFKLKRFWALALVYVFFIGIIILVCVLIVPILVKNILDLISNLPSYISSMQEFFTKFAANNQYLQKTNVSTYLTGTFNDLIKNANRYFVKGLQIIFSNLVNLSSVLIKISTGIVISIYLLQDKEKLLSNIKKFLIVLFGDDNTVVILNFGDKVNKIFQRFVVGRFIDSIVVGTICFLALVVLKIPYAIFISIIVGVTNMIPYFGGMIGMAFACLITLFFSPIKAAEVAVMLILLGELDGLVIGPKIVGEKVGLNPLWIIMGITIGGGLYGIAGMFLGVPVFAVIKVVLQEFMDKRFKEEI